MMHGAALREAPEPRHQTRRLEAAEVSRAASTVPLASWIRLARPYLLPDLAGEAALAAVCAVARRLPGDCAVLEFRLASGEHPVDLSLQILAPPSALEVAGQVEPLPRPGRPLRLEVFGLDPAGMVEYLGRVAPSVLPYVREQARLFEGIERTHLSLDLIGGEVSPRVGIEGSFARQPKGEPRWRELLDRLVAAGMALPARCEAALAWPGWDSFWTAPERWPVEAMGAAGYCVRYLSHVKVVCQPDREPEAKVYLTLGRLESHTPATDRSTLQGVSLLDL